jgi:hypothetical protein
MKLSKQEKNILKQKGFSLQKNIAYLSFAEGGSCSIEKTSGIWVVKVIFIYEDIQESQYEIKDLDQVFGLLGI